MKTILLLLSILGITVSFQSRQNISIQTFSKTENETIKKQAFTVLGNKCNVCHVVKNKRRIFTLENMNDYSEQIYKQVFKLKRMPKGNDSNLTEKEYQTLNNWINSLKNK